MTTMRGTAMPVLAIALCALGAPAAHGAAPPALGAVTVVSGSRAAYADVRVPRPAEVATLPDGTPGITVSGGGALTAIVVVGRTGAARGVTVAGGSAAAAGPAQPFLMPVPQWPTYAGEWYERTPRPDPAVLPPGTYRLYFVSSAPATVTLRLRGLSGRRAVTPRGAVAGAVVPADRELTGGTAVRNNAFAAWSTRTLARRGFALQVLQSRLDTAAAWQLQTCRSNPQPPGPLGDAPPCPGDMNVLHSFVNDRLPSMTADTKLFVRGFAGLAPGAHRVGAVYTAESVASSTAYSVVWLEY